MSFPRTYDLPGPFTLESGTALPRVRVAYRTWGSLAPDGRNAVLICHALTGSADADVWWRDLIGPGRALDPERDFIVCSNVLGSCYGTTGPASVRDGGGLWGPDFPDVTVRDMVRVQAALLESLGVRRLRLVLGGSLGGMQALEWALLHPDRVDAIAPIATSGRHSAWCIALSEAQRLAIRSDPRSGLAIARAIAMCTYRSRESFEERFGRKLREPGLFEVESWLRRHGDRLVERFDPDVYVTLTRAMDSHDVARGRGAYEEVLRSIDIPALVVSIDSDVLYPPEEQRELARLMPRARLATLHSPHGHDAFLIDTEALNGLLLGFQALLGTPQAQVAAVTPARRQRTVDVVMAGPRGRVATALRNLLAERTDADLRLVGALDRHRMAWSPAGIDPLDVHEALADGGSADWERLVELCDGLAERPVFVDCTASPSIAGRYAELLRRGIGVVTPNKLANAGRLSDWRLLHDLSADGSPYRYETTVGAALPVLGPLADLRRAGDRLLAVSAVLSGTLSFVMRQVEAGVPFSEAVREAHVRGYTEPHPGDDLSGEDVARKLLILLREAGFDLEREDVAVEPLLAEGLPDEPDPERFLDALAPWDGVWADRVIRARERGERLLYLAAFDGAGARVGVASLPADHPVARGGPGENVIVYRTDRYFEVPLTISGPGAGPEITATGVLADLIAAAKEMSRRERGGGLPAWGDVSSQLVARRLTFFQAAER